MSLNVMSLISTLCMDAYILRQKISYPVKIGLFFQICNLAQQLLSLAEVILLLNPGTEMETAYNVRNFSALLLQFVLLGIFLGDFYILKIYFALVGSDFTGIRAKAMLGVIWIGFIVCCGPTCIQIFLWTFRYLVPFSIFIFSPILSGTYITLMLAYDGWQNIYVAFRLNQYSIQKGLDRTAMQQHFRILYAMSIFLVVIDVIGASCYFLLFFYIEAIDELYTIAKFTASIHTNTTNPLF
ncbi:hypothetical protein EDD86DRAFT_250328 [Gorgonomyces haynaldii]|nr:hypothetical protein EDD86DRAFT_250328 [Gorgonomyces haynaldii]